MELKVTVEGIERSVTGITEQTTCAQIIYALAHATSQKGRFIMLETFRNAERRLSPNDKPLEVLQKWMDKAPNVTFVMKRVEDENDVNPNLNTTKHVDDLTAVPSLVTFRNPSTASISSVKIAKTGSIPAQNRSTTSLPAYNMGTLTRNRPPPPDYNTVMEQKFASFSRGAHSRPSLPIPQVEDITIAKMGLSHNDLLNLIEKQRQTIEKQRENLFNAELMLPSPIERELLQLERQQENLRDILEPLRQYNWPHHYQKELKESQKLRAAIEATKEAIDKTNSDIEQLCREEEELLKQISELQEVSPIKSHSNALESSPDVSQTNISSLSISTSPHKLRAC